MVSNCCILSAVTNKQKKYACFWNTLLEITNKIKFFSSGCSKVQHAPHFEYIFVCYERRLATATWLSLWRDRRRSTATVADHWHFQVSRYICRCISKAIFFESLFWVWGFPIFVLLHAFVTDLKSRSQATCSEMRMRIHTYTAHVIYRWGADVHVATACCTLCVYRIRALHWWPYLLSSRQIDFLSLLSVSMCGCWCFLIAQLRAHVAHYSPLLFLTYSQVNELSSMFCACVTLTNYIILFLLLVCWHTIYIHTCDSLYLILSGVLLSPFPLIFELGMSGCQGWCLD